MSIKYFSILSGLDRNRTCIWSFGNSYTIHCTTRPIIYFQSNSWDPGTNLPLIPADSVQQGLNYYYLGKPPILLPNILTAIANKITPKNFLITTRPFGPKALSIHLKDISTRYISMVLINMPVNMFISA